MFDRFSACLQVWISQGSEQPSILNIWLVLNVPKFWIYQGSNYAPSFEYARVTPCSGYAWIIHEHVWICLNMSGYVWIYLRVPEFKIGGHESWYTLLVFCFLKTCKKITQKLTHICNIIDIQSFRSQLYKIIIDYLPILAKVTLKQCMGALLISKCF